MEIKVVRNILEANERSADTVREILAEKNIYLINIMGSPGSGKTTLISSLIPELSKYRIAVIEGDVETTTDSEKLTPLGIPIIQINTSIFRGECHLEASWIHSALEDLPLEELDIVLIENIGNLVCPSEFDLGSDLSFVVLSIPEGDDKPIKYPLMFRKTDAVVISKMEFAEAFEYNFIKLEENLRKVSNNPIIKTDAKNGTGLAELAKFIEEKVEKKINA